EGEMCPVGRPGEAAGSGRALEVAERVARESRAVRDHETERPVASRLEEREPAVARPGERLREHVRVDVNRRYVAALWGRRPHGPLARDVGDARRPPGRVPGRDVEPSLLAAAGWDLDQVAVGVDRRVPEEDARAV